MPKYCCVVSGTVSCVSSDATCTCTTDRGASRVAYDASKESDRATQVKWRALRARRNTLLRASDPWMDSDRGLDGTQQTALETYRQDLRDLPADTTDIDNPPWPTKPAWMV